MFGFSLNQYNLEVQWTLAWFPVTNSAPLDRPRMRAGVLTHRSTEQILNSPGIGGGVTVGHLLGQALEGEESLALDGLVAAFVNVRLTHDGFFEVELELKMPGSQQHQRFVLMPDTRLPFMLTARSGSHRVTTHTASVFHGVVATSPRVLNQAGALERFEP